MADDVRIAEGDAVAPGAAQVLATIPLAQLPQGRYIVKVKAAVSGAAPADIGNMKLATTGATVADIANPILSGVNALPVDSTFEQVYLDGASNLVVTALAAGTAAIEYQVQVQAQRTG